VDDKVKHRIVGVVVIAVFLVILIPVLYKNFIGSKEPAQEGIDKNPFAVSDNTDHAKSFQTSQIAHVSLDSPEASDLTVNDNMPENPAAGSIETAPVSTEGSAITSIGDVPTESPALVPVPEPVASTAPISNVATTTTPVDTAPTVKTAPAQSAPTAVSTPSATEVVKVEPKPVTAPVVTKKAVVVKPPIVKKPVVPVVKKRIVVTRKPVMLQEKANYCLQMGAFSNAKNAEYVVNKLKTKGFYHAQLEPMTFPNGTTGQRVVACRVMTRAEALVMRARFAAIIGTTPIITRKG
jgi:cell division septation protein DedD